MNPPEILKKMIPDQKNLKQTVYKTTAQKEIKKTKYN